MRRSILFGLLAFVMAGCVWTGKVEAGIVEPSGNGRTDIRNIRNELAATGSVTLVSGKTYYIPAVVHVKGGDTFDATGATIICSKVPIRNKPTKKDYKKYKNIHIKGGIWKQDDPKGTHFSSFQFTHVQNLVMEDMDIRTTNYVGHAIELIACKNVVIRNCKVTAQGKNSDGAREEMIQLDIAAPLNAPTIDKGLMNGTGCSNVTITGCTVKGAKAICANYAKINAKGMKNHHSNIVIENCKLTGTSGPAVDLSNCIGVKVTGCTIKCTTKKDQSSFYSDGCTVRFNGSTPSQMRKANYIFKKNKIYGGRCGLSVGGASVMANSITVTGNVLYSRSGRAYALSVTENARKRTVKSNKMGNW